MCFTGTLSVGSSCLGSSPSAVMCNSDPQELLTDLITPESIALFAASGAARSPPSPMVKLMTPDLDHVTFSPPHNADRSKTDTKALSCEDPGVGAPGKCLYTLYVLSSSSLLGHQWQVTHGSGFCTLDIWTVLLQTSREGLMEHKPAQGWQMPVWACPCLEQEGNAIDGGRMEKVGG